MSQLFLFLVVQAWLAETPPATETSSVVSSPVWRRAPRVIEVPDERLPKAELLATPEVRTLLGYTRHLLHLHDGHTFGVFTYSTDAPANWLFLIDGRDLSFERHPIPNNNQASHGSDLGKDGHIYTMPYGNGRVYRFDTEKRRFETIDVDVPKEERTWEAFTASSGRVYFGTYPNACLGEYDPVTRRCILFKQIASPAKYVISFSEDPDGHIRFKAWGPGEMWMTFDPKTRELAPSGPPPVAPNSAPAAPPMPPVPEGDEKFHQMINVEGRRFAVSHPSGRFWEFMPEGKSKLLGDTNEPAVQSWWLETVPGAVVGISYLGALFRYDLRTGEFIRKELTNRAPGGNNIMFLETVTPRCVIGANYSQQNLFRIDPETGNVEYPPGAIARVPGEPMCAIGFGGVAYVGIYVQSLISLYDPAQPFAYGKNPRELIDLSVKYEQTRPRDTTTDGKLVFMSSDSTYNKLGGALAVIEPTTNRIDVYHHLIRDQNLPTLAFDPASKLLWGGTDRWGQMHSHPPTQDSALVYAFDPKKREVVTTLVPFKSADVTSVLGVPADGVLVAVSGDQMAVIDTRKREVVFQGPLPIAGLRKMHRGADGAGYCLDGSKLYRWNASENTLTPVALAPGGTKLAEPAPGTWLIGTATSVYRVHLK